MYLRPTGFNSLHLGTITRQRQADPPGGLPWLHAPSPYQALFLPSLCSRGLWTPSGVGRWGGRECPRYSAGPAARGSPGEGRAGGRLTECLQFQEQRAEERIHSPPVRETWVECHGGKAVWDANGSPGRLQRAAVRPVRVGEMCSRPVPFRTSGFLCANGGGGFHL